MTFSIFEFVFITVPELIASVALLFLPLMGVCWCFVEVIDKLSELKINKYVKILLYIIMVYIGIIIEAFFAYGAVLIIALFPMV